jgi:hypothetical protein
MFESLLRRIGASAEQTGYSSATETGCSCYVFSVKKSGTHLLRLTLEQLGMTCIDRLDYAACEFQKPTPESTDTFVLSHRLPSRRWRGRCNAGDAKIIMNIRDPRAVYLSLLDFYDWRRPLSATGLHTVEFPGMHAVEFRREAYRFAFKDRETLGLALLQDELLDDDPFTPWLSFRRARTLFHHPSVLKIRYEDFFSTGGRRGPTGENVTLRICRYLDGPAPADPEQLVARVVGAPTLTRNVALPDRWRTELSPRLLRAFMDRHGDLVREFGYPED